MIQTLINIAGSFERLHSSRVRFRLYSWCVRIAVFALSAVAAFLLRFDFRIPEDQLSLLSLAVIVWITVKSLVFLVSRLDRGWWRFTSVHDVYQLAAANALASIISVPVIYTHTAGAFPKSILVLDFLICFLFTCGLRVLTRLLLELRATAACSRDGERTLIYGAGAAGQMLLREIRSNSELAYDVCGFIDDDAGKRNIRLHGLKVVGSRDDLPAVVARLRVKVVLVAIPSATGPEMAAILRLCHDARVKCKTIPGVGELVNGKALAKQVRDVAVEDLLGRKPVRLDVAGIRGKLSGRVVLVTGAAGSIGSELCRQIARFDVAAIVGLDIAETPLFHIDNQMRAAYPAVRFIPVVGSVQNDARLAELFQQHRPAFVYHAAAYKHVPMMENHIFEAFENNVLGTCNVAVAAREYGAEQFVLISSDKAVRPTNIMGATKRVAELLIRWLQNGGPRYVSVRFGNVLGSNGSVVPTFKGQIAAGGPVTITDPEMRRYFMTIPEAAQLVIQASTMGAGGETFVLDMGQPVRIVDLATNLILLSGLRPGEDVKIEFTGIRRGEKLYEELHASDEDTAGTLHEKIRVFTGNQVPDAFGDSLHEIRRCCSTRDCRRLILELKHLVPEYNPSEHVLRAAFAGANAAQVSRE